MTSVPYLYQEYRLSTVGALAPISEVVGGQQRLTKDAAKALYAILKAATLIQGAKITPDGQIVFVGGGDLSVVDFATYKFYVTSPAPADAFTPMTQAGNVLLVNLEEAQKNIFGTPTDLTVIIAKDADIASKLSQPSAPFAVLPPFEQAIAAKTEEKKGIKPAAIVGALVGGGVGFLVGGPVGAIVGAIGTGVLVQQVAA